MRIRHATVPEIIEALGVSYLVACILAMHGVYAVIEIDEPSEEPMEWPQWARN